MEEIAQYYNLSSLLRINGIDVRKAAKDNQSLHTGEYFNLLTKFIEQAPQIKEILSKNDSQNMEETQKLLDSIGCDVKYLTENFDKIIKQLTEAKRDEKPEALDGILSADDITIHKTYDAQVLNVALKLLDHEQATRKIPVLAVDDAPTILKTISTALGDDYKVYGMTDPRMLEKFLQQITPELFLLDYSMPELSGFDCIPIIRSFEKHKDTPIIFLTSMGTTDNVSTALSLGAKDYIVKPFQGKQLREKIAKHLGRPMP
jgi:CheY-like chemotaxis protein